MRAIQDLKARGLKVTLAPFILMDIAGRQHADRSGNRRSGAAGLSLARPHHLRPGARRGPDRRTRARPRRSSRRRSSARRQPGDFSNAAGGRRLFRAGRVELSAHGAPLRAPRGDGGRGRRVPDRLGAVGLTTLRSATSAYPFVDGLKTLAADVRSVVGGDDRRSPTRRTGANISGTSRPTAPATCTSISIRCGRMRRSISSASTSTTR